MKKPTKATRGVPKKAAFLAAFCATASVTKAAKAAKIDRALHYRWLTEDADYAAQFEAAKAEAAQVLEDEAIRRAHQGITEPLVYQGQFSYKQRPVLDENGQPTGRYENYGLPLTIRKYSDTLLVFLLKAFNPRRFRERVAAEISGPDGGPIPLEDERLKHLADDELAQLLAIARKLATPGGDGSGDSPPSP